VELRMERRGLNLQDRDEREQEDEAEKNPVEVAIGREAGHVAGISVTSSDELVQR
jgi:hypothetical protein